MSRSNTRRSRNRGTLDQQSTDPDAQVRQVAVDAIARGWPQDDDTLPFLHKHATTDPDEYVRLVADKP